METAKNMKFDNQINGRYFLGKGEVDSSILSGSTRITQQINAFALGRFRPNVSLVQNATRTPHVDPWKIRGKRSRSIQPQHVTEQEGKRCFRPMSNS